MYKAQCVSPANILGMFDEEMGETEGQERVLGIFGSSLLAYLRKICVCSNYMWLSTTMKILLVGLLHMHATLLLSFPSTTSHSPSLQLSLRLTLQVNTPGLWTHIEQQHMNFNNML